MKKHIKLARDMGLNWQAALIEDAQSDIKAVIRDAVMRSWTWKQTNDAIVQIVDETVDELESDTLKVKARVSLLRYATEQYRRMKDAIPESFFPLFFAAKKIRESKGGNAKAETIRLARQIVRQDPESAAAKTIQSVLDQVSGKATAQITKAEYVEIAQPTQRYMRDYMADVEQAFAELATSDAKDGYGSSVSLRNIAEMTVRYEKNMAQLKELRDSGTRLVWISAHANCSTRCQPWQGRLYSLDGSSGQVGGKTYIPLDRAMNVPYTTKAGKTYQNGCISGYNCRHYLIPYESGVRPVEESAEVVDKYREINERQRNFERDIRYAKELAATYREINPKLAQWYDRQAKKLYEEYKQYSEKNDVAYYPDRTDIFPGEDKRTAEKISDRIEARIKLDDRINSGSVRLSENAGAQAKHLKDEKGYIDGRSYFTIDKQQIHDLLQERVGTGEVINGRGDSLKEIIAVDQPVGKVVLNDSTEKDAYGITVHHSQKGLHAVPRRRGIR